MQLYPDMRASDRAAIYVLYMFDRGILRLYSITRFSSPARLQ